MSQRWRAALQRLQPAGDAPLPEAFWWLWLTTLIIWSSRLFVPFLMVFLTRYLGWSVSSASAMLAAYGGGGAVAVFAAGAVVDRSRFAGVPRLHRRLATAASMP